MARPAHSLWTLKEFLAFDDGSDTRYELVQGQIFAMTPPARAWRARRAAGPIDQPGPETAM